MQAQALAAEQASHTELKGKVEEWKASMKQRQEKQAKALADLKARVSRDEQELERRGSR